MIQRSQLHGLPTAGGAPHGSIGWLTLTHSLVAEIPAKAAKKNHPGFFSPAGFGGLGPWTQPLLTIDQNLTWPGFSCLFLLQSRTRASINLTGREGTHISFLLLGY